MCAQEHDKEWSGVLFYSTEGSFGEDDFKITAEEFYLMDIGTSVFTGYDFDNEFVAYLMANPRLLKMKKGHIHSHNKMNVFFSGTDTDEIRDNSEFHNYYFSLIVNNKNEMTAKVAFRGKQVTKSVTSYSYKGDNGAEKTGTYESTIDTEVCYVYNTQIDKSFLGDLSNKYQIIKSRPTVVPATVKTAGAHGATIGKEVEIPFPKYPKVDRKEDQFYWEGDDQVDVWGDEAKAAGVPIEFPEDEENLEFIAKIMLGDLLTKEDPRTIIKRFSKMTEGEMYAIQGRMEKRLMSYYIDCFPEDQNLLKFDDVMADCQELVQTFDRKYDNVTDMLWEVFNTEIK